MDPFGSDFNGIEDLFNRLSGRSGVRSGFSREDSGDILETIPAHKGTFFVFDFSHKTVSDVAVVDELDEDEYGQRVHTGRKILQVTFNDGEAAKYVLPKNVKRTKLDWTTTNGILEVFLRR